MFKCRYWIGFYSGSVSDPANLNPDPQLQSSLCYKYVVLQRFVRYSGSYPSPTPPASSSTSSHSSTGKHFYGWYSINASYRDFTLKLSSNQHSNELYICALYKNQFINCKASKFYPFGRFKTKLSVFGKLWIFFLPNTPYESSVFFSFTFLMGLMANNLIIFKSCLFNIIFHKFINNVIDVCIFNNEMYDW